LTTINRKDAGVATEEIKARDVIGQFLDRSEKQVDGWSDDTALWGNGLGLDSLEAAELSAMLEDEFGSDPFSAGGELPGSVGDILAFYAPT
jgi:acyl carrier protein